MPGQVSGQPYDGRPGGLQTGSPPSLPPPSICPSCSVSGGPRAFWPRVPIITIVTIAASLGGDTDKKRATSCTRCSHEPVTPSTNPMKRQLVIHVGLCVRRVHFVMIVLDTRQHRHRQAGRPAIGPSEFPEPLLPPVDSVLKRFLRVASSQAYAQYILRKRQLQRRYHLS